MAKKRVKKKVVLRHKPKLSARDKAALRRIMKTVRNIKIWNLSHGK
jgi:hypothetical protein